jgi:hypothetical protein
VAAVPIASQTKIKKKNVGFGLLGCGNRSFEEIIVLPFPVMSLVRNVNG